MDCNYATQYRQIYENHWWWRAREAAVIREVSRLLSPRGANSILDVGCGDGLLFERLERYGYVEGVEIDPLTIDLHGPWIDRIHVGPFDKSFRTARRYDLILMLDVLEHMPDPAAALRHAASLLNEEGALLITVPAFRSLWTSHDDLNRHFKRFTKGTFANLASESTVKIERMRYLFQWTCPAKLAVRFKELLVPGKASPPSVPPAWVNFILIAMTRCEEATISRLPMPFGSSLLAVCRK